VELDDIGLMDIFWGCPSFDLLTNRGVGCGIDIYRKRLGSSKGERILLEKTIFF
jgi:hypothetical protein